MRIWLMVFLSIFLFVSEVDMAVRPNLSLAELVINEAQSMGIPPAVALSMVHVESNWNPNAVSGKNARGLFQIIPGTLSDMARVLGRVLNPFNPIDSAQAGLTYLRQMLDRYNGNIHLALAAYNGGMGNVDKYKGIPPFMETQNYVKKIVSLIPEYEAWLAVKSGEAQVPSDFKGEKPPGPPREVGLVGMAGLIIGAVAGAIIGLALLGD